MMRIHSALLLLFVSLLPYQVQGATEVNDSISSEPLTAAKIAALRPVNGDPLTAAEIASLDPVCKLILVYKPHAHIDQYAQKKNAALFARPEYRMAKNAIHVHHRCWALVSKYRSFNATSSQKKHGYLSRFHDDMGYVIRNMPSTWEFMPQMHVENGEMYFWDKKFVEALTEAQKALNLNPDYAKAYALQTNAYNALKQKDKALAAATEGLKHNPNSRALKRLYDEAGGKPPYPVPHAKPQVPEAEQAAPTEETAEPTEATPQSEQEKQPDATAIPSSGTSPENRPKSNPYCRFCP